MFRRVLVANRGEIAVRVIRACREMGVKTVAVYSDADAQALHVKLADEAVRLGPPPSTESYLVQEKVIEAAERTGAEAIHPGYGFLSENFSFVRRCEKSGVKFIGPSSKAMEAMGDKVSAKRNAVKAGVPVAKASDGAVSDPAKAAKIAHDIGFPVIIKAVHGGGGIGMKIVEREADLPGAIESAMSTAASAFGSPDVFIEKFIDSPRHIEFQILGDEHGHVIHLGERECSVQRRNQKLLEESPSPALTPEMRTDLGEKAAKLARLVGYANAGTLEFLYKDGEFYFMEMNTRLQVEHPVTELVTGMDLVRWQLRIASGEPLTVKQSDVSWRGHALEVRLNAEDPYRGFAPSPGTVEHWQPPLGAGVRVDSYLYDGYTIPATYDSLVAKIVTWAPSRPENLQRMARALDETQVIGVTTNLPFHKLVVRDPVFIEGKLSTSFIRDRRLVETLEGQAASERAKSKMRAAAVAAALSRAAGGGIRGIFHRQELKPLEGGPEPSRWARAGRDAALARGGHR
ncbi:MAG: acetyl-CoA carboxylase biotin carboxylase subunit [Thermoplasmatota archaeon]